MTQEVVDEFKERFKNLLVTDLSRLDEIYHNDVVFRDPVHEIRGLVGLEDYFYSLCIDLKECRFEFLDEVVDDHAAYIKWVMHFEHPKLGKRIITVRGVSHLQVGDKITFHEDCYDMGAMIYEQLPVIGGLTRWLKNRLTS